MKQRLEISFGMDIVCTVTETSVTLKNEGVFRFENKMTLQSNHYQPSSRRLKSAEKWQFLSIYFKNRHYWVELIVLKRKLTFSRLKTELLVPDQKLYISIQKRHLYINYMKTSNENSANKLLATMLNTNILHITPLLMESSYEIYSFRQSYWHNNAYSLENIFVLRG